ncbi:hypothetical protein, partial [Burkholderia sp.]|uniref:hypothetical protein n=1 Tax=Burkholderia sp. TaxID=36773 RepID=UPI0025896F1F
RACKRGGYGNFRVLHCRPPSLNRSMDRISSRRVPQCAGGFDFNTPAGFGISFFAITQPLAKNTNPYFASPV